MRKVKIQEKFQISFCKILKNKIIVTCKSTAEEVSFEWSHHRISATDSKVRTTLHVFLIDSKVRTTLHVFLIDSGSGRGKEHICIHHLL